MHHLKMLLFAGTAGMPDEDKGRVIVVNALCLLTMSLAGGMGTFLFFVSHDYGILVSSLMEVVIYSGIILLNHKRKYLLACIGFLLCHNMAVIYFGICRNMASEEQLLTVFLCIVSSLIFKPLWQTLLAWLFTLSILGIELYCSSNDLFTGFPPIGERSLYHNLGLIAILIMTFAAIYCYKAYDVTVNRSLQQLNTDLQVLNANLQEHNEHLENLVAERTQNVKYYTKILMHEVGTELTALVAVSSAAFQRLRIKNGAPGAEETTPQNTIERLVNKIKDLHRIALRVSNIVKNTLGLAKIEKGNFYDLNIANFSILDWANELTATMQCIADGKTITIVPEYGSNLPEYVLSDRILLDNTVRNLLSNAIRFSPEHSNIRLAIYAIDESGPKLCIEVEDHGPGILRDIVDDIFLPYVTTGGGGTGLGLALVKSSVGYLGGTIDVLTEIDKGSIFRVCIPLVPGSKEEEMALQEEKQKLLERFSGNRELKVLVAEDDSLQRTTLSMMLKHLGCRPYTAENGEECLRGLRDHRPDILILDIHMPVVDGEEVLTMIRTMADPQLAQIPILIYSADPYVNFDSDFVEHKPDGMLKKPCELIDLCDGLNTAIRHAELRLQRLLNIPIT